MNTGCCQRPRRCSTRRASGSLRPASIAPARIGQTTCGDPGPSNRMARTNRPASTSRPTATASTTLRIRWARATPWPGYSPNSALAPTKLSSWTARKGKSDSVDGAAHGRDAGDQQHQARVRADQRGCHRVGGHGDRPGQTTPAMIILKQDVHCQRDLLPFFTEMRRLQARPCSGRVRRINGEPHWASHLATISAWHGSPKRAKRIRCNRMAVSL